MPLTGAVHFPSMAGMARPGEARKRQGIFTAEVLSNQAIGSGHYRLRLGLESFPPSQPGQFVQLQCRAMEQQASRAGVEWPADRPPRLAQPELAAKEPLLRRPFSLAGRGRLDAGVELVTIYRAIGLGTGCLAKVEPGRELSLIGPLGNPFGIRREKPAAALVGGGVGLPPLIYLAEALAAAGKSTTAFCGIRSADLLPVTLVPSVKVEAAVRPTPCVAEFAAFGVDSVIATDDGSLGYAGVVSDAFASWLEGSDLSPGELVVYSCGPAVMMRAVAEVCAARGIECQLAMERHMACGMGTCQSCVVKVRDDSDRGWSFKLCCTDGPIFDAGDIVWD